MLGLLVYLLFIHKKITLAAVFGIAVLWAALSCFPTEYKRHIRIDTVAVLGASTWRSQIWEDSLEMIARRPFFGHGPNTYMPVFQEFRRKYDGNFYYGPTYAHNCYVQIAAEIGLAGLAAFLWIIIVFFRHV